MLYMVYRQAIKPPKQSKGDSIMTIDLTKYIECQSNEKVIEAIKSNTEETNTIQQQIVFPRNPVTGKTYTNKNAEFLSKITKALNWDDEYAGFKQWLEVGRKVKKGEKAITVLHPCFKKLEDGTEKVYFKRVAIFNKFQTEQLA